LSDNDPNPLRISANTTSIAESQKETSSSADLTKLLDAFRYARKDPDASDDTWGGGIVLIGAGCSASAGIPLTLGVVDIALRRMALRLRLRSKTDLEQLDGQTVYDLLHNEGLLVNIKSEYGPKLYGEVFGNIFRDATSERTIIREAINKGKDKINWAHLRLGQLVKDGYIHTVLTTNFDQLALKGIVMNGIFPAVADGLEALNRVDPRPSTPQLVHIHGSLHNYRRINSDEQIRGVGGNRDLQTSISSLLQAAHFLLIVGYRGEEEGLMQPLEAALKSFRETPIFWAFHGREPSEAALKLKEDHKAILLLEQDADRLFDSLAKGLKLELPIWMEKPIDTLIQDFTKVAQPANINEIKTVFERHSLNLSKLKECEAARENESPQAMTEADFAAALLKGDLKTAREQLKENLLVAEKWAMLATAAADAIVEREEQTALAFLREAWENLASDPLAHLTIPKMMRIAEALLSNEEFDAAESALFTVRPQINAAEQKFRWANLSHELGDRLYAKGYTAKARNVLLNAIKAYREVLESQPEDRVTLDWAATQNNLGIALSDLGEREVGTALLEEAVTAYREALKEYTRDRAPLNWAMTQNNLGTALAPLGEREAGTARLEEAVTAFREALKERTRDRVPLDWAMTQNNLGAAMSTLGAREAGTARLEEAITAYSEALKERTRDRLPLKWAMTQNNFGNALSDLGEREPGTARLEDAVAAYREALKERTRDRVPLAWAMTQNNLGNALCNLGQRKRDTLLLEDAVTAYRAALEERPRDRVPLDWAMTQNNLGNALSSLGENEDDTSLLEEAVIAYRAALEERTRDRVPRDWAGSQHGLGNCLAELASRSATPEAHLAAAITHMENAVEGYREVGDGYWGPIAEKRLAELKARQK
jgi:tetratricopeptide (TPR) repeat protein